MDQDDVQYMAALKKIAAREEKKVGREVGREGRRGVGYVDQGDVQ